MEEIEQTKKDETILVKWKNPPSVSDLQQEFDDAKSSHSDQVKKIENYLYHLEHLPTFQHYVYSNHKTNCQLYFQTILHYHLDMLFYHHH